MTSANTTTSVTTIYLRPTSVVARWTNDRWRCPFRSKSKTPQAASVNVVVCVYFQRILSQNYVLIGTLPRFGLIAITFDTVNRSWSYTVLSFTRLSRCLAITLKRRLVQKYINAAAHYYRHLASEGIVVVDVSVCVCLCLCVSPSVCPVSTATAGASHYTRRRQCAVSVLSTCVVVNMFLSLRRR